MKAAERTSSQAMSEADRRQLNSQPLNNSAKLTGSNGAADAYLQQLDARYDDRMKEIQLASEMGLAKA